MLIVQHYFGNNLRSFRLNIVRKGIDEINGDGFIIMAYDNCMLIDMHPKVSK